MAESFPLDGARFFSRSDCRDRSARRPRCLELGPDAMTGHPRGAPGVLVAAHRNQITSPSSAPEGRHDEAAVAARPPYLASAAKGRAGCFPVAGNPAPLNPPVQRRAGHSPAAGICSFFSLLSFPPRSQERNPPHPPRGATDAEERRNCGNGGSEWGRCAEGTPPTVQSRLHSHSYGCGRKDKSVFLASSSSR